MTSLRDLGRMDNWWEYKIPPVLAIAYASALLCNASAAFTARSIAVLVFVGICAGSYGHIVNDIFDLEADRRAGRRNRMAPLLPWQRLALCAFTIGLGFVPSAFFHWSRQSFLLLALEYLLPTVYSVPPLRLKERGALGVICDALGAHAVPCLYALSVLTSGTRDPGLGLAFPVIAAAWALCLGVKGILIHELEDHDSDACAGVCTFATGRRLEVTRGWINRTYAGELLAFSFLLMLLFRAAPLLVAGGALYSSTIWFRMSRDGDSRIRVRHRAAIERWQFSHPFYESYFPVTLALQCALRDPSLILLPLLQMLAFREGVLWRTRELGEFALQVWAWFVRKTQREPAYFGVSRLRALRRILRQTE